jgi:hypothetical protein
MKALFACAALALLTLTAGPTMAETQPVATVRPKDVPTKFEYYYRVKWGSLKEFVALYDRNHKPLLEEMQKAGFVVEMKTEYPFTHLAGGPRWDVRVTITYRDAAAAINDPAWEEAWADAKQRLYPDSSRLEAEEARRFLLVEDHWDVIVSDYPG